MKLNTFQLPVSNSKCNFLFSDFELVTPKRNKKGLTIELVTRSNFFHFFDLELVTRSVTFYFSTSR